ncbi:hypothetical protein PR048_006220 [Dryococelus australis]|uniref:Uncharacterized protein n=1 Tax=Dryococelus australis TaxID=614101 RepID=A0ABQ9IBL4_9NEOP|nr:hypothetical protein PR048_006220 [Dryococelus australis]
MGTSCHQGTVQTDGDGFLVGGLFRVGLPTSSLTGERFKDLLADHMHRFPRLQWTCTYSKRMNQPTAPALSPDLTPIEHTWDVVESYVRAVDPAPACLYALWKAVWCPTWSIMAPDRPCHAASQPSSGQNEAAQNDRHLAVSRSAAARAPSKQHVTYIVRRQHITVPVKILSGQYSVTTEILHVLRVGAMRHKTCVLVSPVSLSRFLTLDALSPASRGGTSARTLLSHQSKLGATHGGAALGFLHVGIVAHDAAGRRVFSGIFLFPRPCIPALIYTHLALPSSALKTTMLRTPKLLHFPPLHSITHPLQNILLEDFTYSDLPRRTSETVARNTSHSRNLLISYDGSALDGVARWSSRKGRRLTQQPKARVRVRDPHLALKGRVGSNMDRARAEHEYRWPHRAEIHLSFRPRASWTTRASPICDSGALQRGRATSGTATWDAGRSPIVVVGTASSDARFRNDFSVDRSTDVSTAAHISCREVGRPVFRLSLIDPSEHIKYEWDSRQGCHLLVLLRGRNRPQLGVLPPFRQRPDFREPYSGRTMEQSIRIRRPKLMRVFEVNMERHLNEGAGNGRSLKKNPPTNGIVRHDSHLRKSGDPTGD